MILFRPKVLRPLLATLVAFAAAFALTPPPASALTTQCGAKLPKAGGGYRTCTFGDDFKGGSLNNGNWLPMTTWNTGFTQAGECYVNDKSHITVANGFLTLTATKASSVQPCGDHDSEYQSGMVVTKDKFAQTYGRFEVRAKMPVGTGLQSAFWMWPRDMSYGDSSGEIDIAEWYGAYPDIVSPTLHMRDETGVDHPINTWCNVANAEEAFHTYTVEWQPSSFTFLYDGVPCMTVSNWDPVAGLAAPKPFDKPFFMILQLALGHYENRVADETPFPAKFVIDYVRAWR